MLQQRQKLLMRMEKVNQKIFQDQQTRQQQINDDTSRHNQAGVKYRLNNNKSRLAQLEEANQISNNVVRELIGDNRRKYEAIRNISMSHHADAAVKSNDR